MTTPKPIVQYGFVVMLDVLGARHYDAEAAIKFIQLRGELLKSLEPLRQKLASLDSSLPEPYVATFGDTLIFTWAVGKDRIGKGLPGVAEWIKLAIRWGIMKEVLLRGALSIGEFVVQDATVLGPAISDCASWYESANWFGVVLTPNAGLHQTALAESLKHHEPLKHVRLDQWFVEYSVPLSNGTKRRMWCSSWPWDVWRSPDVHTNLTPLESLCELLCDCKMPKGTEDKYSNSIEFFNWFGQYFPELVQQISKI